MIISDSYNTRILEIFRNVILKLYIAYSSPFSIINKKLHLYESYDDIKKREMYIRSLVGIPIDGTNDAIQYSLTTTNNHINNHSNSNHNVNVNNNVNNTTGVLRKQQTTSSSFFTSSKSKSNLTKQSTATITSNDNTTTTDHNGVITSLPPSSSSSSLPSSSTAVATSSTSSSSLVVMKTSDLVNDLPLCIPFHSKELLWSS